MRQRKGFQVSIRTSMICLFSALLTVILLVMGTLLGNYFVRSTMSVMLQYNHQLAEQTRINIDNYVSELESLISIVSRNPQVIAYIENHHENDAYTNLKNTQSVSEFISSIISEKDDIENLLIMNGDMLFEIKSNHSANIHDPFLQDAWNKHSQSVTTKLEYYDPHIPSYYVTSKVQYTIPLIQPLRDYSNYTTQNIGMTVVEINTKHFRKYFSELMHNYRFSAKIINDNNRVVYSTDDETIGRFYQNTLHRTDFYGYSVVRDSATDQMYLQTKVQSRINDWTIVLNASMVPMIETAEKTNITLWAMVLVAILLVWVVSAYLSTYIAKPVSALAVYMQEMRPESFQDTLLNVNRYREVTALYARFNEMMERINGLIEQAYHQKIRQRDAEYEALQAKINPHFIYNTFQTINSLATLERCMDIEKVVSALSKMMEYLIYRQNDIVSIMDELDYIRRYLRIQEIRYGGNFTVRWHVAAGVGEYRIMKLLIQPVVENAIKYGLADCMQGGILSIDCHFEGKSIVFEISDNGAGIREADLVALRKRLENERDEENEKSIGLPNVQGRIRLRYGEAYGLKIESTEDVGTRVTVTIPALTEKFEWLTDQQRRLGNENSHRG